MVTKMNNKISFVMLGVLAGAWSAGANAVSVSATCPGTVRVSQPLDVPVKFKNDQCNKSVTINRVMVGLAGNQGGLLKLQGPFSINLNPALVVPPAACDQGWPITPGEITKNIRIVGSMPGALAGKVALGYIEILQDSGKGQGGDTCLVEVVR